jgi:hypothetical protein
MKTRSQLSNDAGRHASQALKLRLRVEVTSPVSDRLDRGLSRIQRNWFDIQKLWSRVTVTP